MRGAVGEEGRGIASPCPPPCPGEVTLSAEAGCVSAHHARSGHVLSVTPLTAEQTRNSGLIFRNPSTMTILYRRNIGDGKRKREETRKHTHKARPGWVRVEPPACAVPWQRRHAPLVPGEVTLTPTVTCVSAHHPRSGHMLDATPHAPAPSKNISPKFRNPSTMTIPYRGNISDGKRKKEEGTHTHTHKDPRAGCVV